MNYVVSKTALSAIITEYFTIDQIAERSGLSISCIKEVTSGTCNPTLKTLEKIANAIDIKLDSIISQSLRIDTPDRGIVRKCLDAVRKFEAAYGKIELPSGQHDLFSNLERDNNASKGITKKQYGYLCSIVRRIPSMTKARKHTKTALASRQS